MRRNARRFRVGYAPIKILRIEYVTPDGLLIPNGERQ